MTVVASAGRDKKDANTQIKDSTMNILVDPESVSVSEGVDRVASAL